MQAEASAALVAARGEKRIERLPLHVRRHAGAIVGENDLDVVAAARPRRDRDRARAPVGEGMIGGVEEKIGQDLPVGAGIAVDQEPIRHVDRQLYGRSLQDRPQARHDLVGRLRKAELPAFGMRAVHRHLLERLDQFTGAVQIGHQLLGGVARGVDEFVELGAAQRLGLQFVFEDFGAAGKAGGHREADADRIVDLVGDAGDQAAKRGETFGVDQVLLRGVELEQRALGPFLRGAQFLFGLPLGDGVVAEHFDRARHRADLVLGLGALHLAVVIA